MSAGAVTRRGAFAGGAALAIPLLVAAGPSGRLPRGRLPTSEDVKRLGEYHVRFAGARAWRLTSRGVECAGVGVLGTGMLGEDAVARAASWFGAEVRAAAEEFDVPVESLYATLAVETVSGSSSREQAARARGGSGEVGAMQILPATARAAMGNPRLTVEALRDPLTNLRAGAAYIAWQSESTEFDPPLVSAAYNAGGVYQERSARNPWRMRCWPIGTGGYITKRVGYFNDAMRMVRLRPGTAGGSPSWAKALSLASGVVPS